MVKNIPTIERSTKIRFGKHATDDQAENTIVFNASNVAIDAPIPGSIYMTPLRVAEIEDATFIGYDPVTKEVVDTGVLTSLLGGVTLDSASLQGNVITQTVPHFANVTTAFTTLPGSNVGISNINPAHALDVGSEFHVTDGGEVRIGPSVLIDSSVTNQIQVAGRIDTDSITLDHIGLANNNPTITGLSLGSSTFLQQPTGSINAFSTTGNVSATFYHGDSYFLSNLTLDNIITQGNAAATKTIEFNTPVTAFITNSNVGIINTSPIHTLDVGSNLFVDDIGSDILNITGNVNATNYLKSKKIEVSEDAIISGNLTVEGTTTFIDTINTVFKDPIISLANNNPSTTTDIGIIMQQPVNESNPTITFRGDENEMMIGYTLNSASDTEIVPDSSNVIDLHVYGNIIAQNNLTITSGNIETTSGFFKGDGGILSNVTLQQVTDTSNSTSNTVLFTNAHTAFTTDLTSNVGVKLDQLSNVIITSPDDHKSLLYIDGNWIDDYVDFTSIEVKAGEALSKGDVVYIHDGSGDTPEVRKADSSSASTMPAIGIVMDGSIAQNNNGHVVTFGTFGMTFNTNFQKGEILYVSNTTPGELMNTVPFSNTDKIQNVGIVVKSGEKILVTGVGRSNDIPNAEEVYAQPSYVYVNSSGNELKKILTSNLSANNQTLDMVTSWSNSTTNTIESTHATTGFISSGNVHVGSNIQVSGLTSGFVPIVGSDKFLHDSVIEYSGDTTTISSNVEITGNLSVLGNTFTIESNSLVINDRVLGIANNNVSHSLDVGIIMGHPEHNIAFIHHGEPDGQDTYEHELVLGYTDNVVTDNHVLYTEANLITFHVLGNIIAQNNLTLTSGELTAITVNSNVVGDNVVATNIYGTIAGANTISASTISATDTVTSISTSGNVLVTGNVTANKFYGDGSAITSLDPSRLSSQVLITEGGTGLTSVAQNELLLGPASGTALSTLPPYAPGDSTKKFLRSSATGIAWDDVSSTLQTITDGGNTTSNIVQFTNTTTGIEITSNIDFVNKITLKSTSGTKSNLFVVNAIQLDPGPSPSPTTVPAAMTANSSGGNTASSGDSSVDAYKAFDGSDSTHYTSPLTYSTSSKGSYGATSYASSLGGVLGEWIKLQIPSAITPTSVFLKSRPDGTDSAGRPASWRILGSNDNTNWTQLHSSTTVVDDSSGTTESFTNTTSYSYLAFQVTNINSNYGKWTLSRLSFTDTSTLSPLNNVLSYNTTTGEIYDSGGQGGSTYDNITEENANVLIGSNLTINSLGSNVLTVSGNVSADNITIGGLNIAASPFGLDDVVSSAVGSNVTSNVLTLGGVITDTLTVSGNTTSQNIKLTNTDITASVTSGTITVDAKEKTYGTAPLVVSTTDVSNLVFSNLITGAQIVIPILADGGAINISSAMTNVNFYAMTSDVSVTQDKHALMTLSNLYGNIYMNAIGFS